MGFNFLYEVHCFIADALAHVGINWWLLYREIKVMTAVCLLLHTVLLRLELRKPYPRIPYYQDDVLDLLLREW